MHLSFLGGTGTVTGSKYLLTLNNGKKILIDCGLFQGYKKLRLRNWAPSIFDPKTIDAVLLTHAHIDHSGYIPLLVKNGFKGKIYCTFGTKDLCSILLADSGYLQEQEAYIANKYGYSKHHPALPFYTVADAEIALKQFAPQDYDTVISLLDDISFKKEQSIPDIPVYLDSPMAVNATKIMYKHRGDLHLSESECMDLCNAATYTRTPEESKELDNSKSSKIIISASGMATGGRILFHLKTYAPDPKNTILFAGYQTGGTRGARMLQGEKEIKLHGQMVQVRAQIESLDNLSAHADYDEILAWLSHLKKPPRKIFITHGEPDAANSLRIKIEQLFGWDCIVPEYQQTEILI